MEYYYCKVLAGINAELENFIFIREIYRMIVIKDFFEVSINYDCLDNVFSTRMFRHVMKIR